MAGFSLQTPQDNVGVASHADAVFGMFEESAFSDIGDIWAFFSDDLAGFDGDDSFISFMSDFGLPVDPPVVRSTPVQSIADLALAVRLETERMESGSRVAVPERRALPMSAPVRGRKKKRAATGGLFDALPVAEAEPQGVGVPRPVGSGPVFPDPSLFVQTKPRGKAGRAASGRSVGKPDTKPAGFSDASALPVLGGASPPSPRPVFPTPVAPGVKGKKSQVVVEQKTITGGLFDLVLAPAPTSPASSALMTPTPSVADRPLPAVADRSRVSLPAFPVEVEPSHPPSPPGVVQDSVEELLHSAPAQDAVSGADGGTVSVTPVERATDGAVGDSAIASVKAEVKPTPIPTPPPASPPAPSPPSVLAGRPMPTRSRAAQVSRAPAPFPRGDDDRVDFSQAIQPSKPKGWPAKREPGVARPIRPTADPEAARPSNPLPRSASVVAAPASSLPGKNPPVGDVPSEDIVDFFAEFDGLWDGDEA